MEMESDAIIHCKNCMHNGRIDTDCPLRNWIHGDDDYCSYGELEEENMDNSEYVELYDMFPESLKKCMISLYIQGVDRDKHVWVTYSEVQDMIVKLLKSGVIINIEP